MDSRRWRMTGRLLPSGRSAVRPWVRCCRPLRRASQRSSGEAAWYAEAGTGPTGSGAAAELGLRSPAGRGSPPAGGDRCTATFGGRRRAGAHHVPVVGLTVGVQTPFTGNALACARPGRDGRADRRKGLVATGTELEVSTDRDRQAH